MKYTAIFFTALMMSPLIHAAEHARKYRDASSALKAAKEAKTDEGVNESLDEVAAQEPESDGDVKAIHDSLQLLDTKYSNGEKAQKFMAVRASLSQRLALSTAAHHHSVIAALLESEEKGVPSALIPKQITQLWARQEFSRAERFGALAKAAGDGNNREALPILRKTVEKHPDSMYSEHAITAIGKIGDTQDIDVFIKKLKANPKARINLTSFGPRLIRPVMRELESGGLTNQQKGALRTTLSEGHSHDAIPQYVQLLGHPDVEIASVAAQAIAKESTPEDRDVLSAMLKSPKSEVRFPAVNAIAGKAWDVKFIPVLIELLKNDRDDGIRVTAMTALAEHHVQEAMPAIEEASRDSNSRVRGNAIYFLKKINKK